MTVLPVSFTDPLTDPGGGAPLRAATAGEPAFLDRVLRDKINETITAVNGKASTATATTSAAGLLSAADKSKLDGVAAGANVVGTGVTKVVKITQAAYDGLTTKDAATLYVIA